MLDSPSQCAVQPRFQPPHVRATLGLGQRHGQILLMFFGVMISYALRINVSLAVVAMGTYNHNTPDIKVITFTPLQEGLVLSSFFMGYMILQVPVGTLARKHGACIQLGVAIALSGVATVLTPWITIYLGWIGLTAARILTGLFEGFLYPCVNQHLTKWIPPPERSRLFAFTFGGSIVGNFAMSFIGGLLAAGKGGWPSIFYFSGGTAILWGILCVIFGYNSPSVHKHISQEEKFYIENSQKDLSKDDSNLETPWRDIWLSVPVWALLITFLGNIWGYYLLLTMVPSYIEGVLHFPIDKNGALSSLPYIAMWISNFIYSIVADLIVNRNILSLQASRKLWNSLSQYGPGLCLLLLAICKTNVVLAITLLTLSSSLNAGMYVGYLMNPTDLSPNFTGTLMGLANGLANITAILGPLMSNVIVKDKGNVQEWNLVFLITAGIYFVGSTIFLVFGSAEVQPWNQPEHNRTTVSKQAVTKTPYV